MRANNAKKLAMTYEEKLKRVVHAVQSNEEDVDWATPSAPPYPSSSNASSHQNTTRVQQLQKSERANRVRMLSPAAAAPENQQVGIFKPVDWWTYVVVCSIRLTMVSCEASSNCILRHMFGVPWLAQHQVRAHQCPTVHGHSPFPWRFTGRLLCFCFLFCAHVIVQKLQHFQKYFSSADRSIVRNWLLVNCRAICFNPSSRVSPFLTFLGARFSHSRQSSKGVFYHKVQYGAHIVMVGSMIRLVFLVCVKLGQVWRPLTLRFVRSGTQCLGSPSQLPLSLVLLCLTVCGAEFTCLKTLAVSEESSKVT